MTSPVAVKFPAPHASQLLAPSSSLYVLAGQNRHAADVLAPRSVPYMPMLQLAHTRLAPFAPSVEYVPGSHAPHDVAPGDEDVPLGHALQGVEELESWSKVPARH